MNVAELKEQSPAQLTERLLKLKEEQFKLRMQKATGQLNQTHLLSLNKKAIAKVKTVLTQQKLGK